MREALRVVLVAPRNPLNIGAAARAMSNFGFTSLRLVNPYHVAFREARSAVKAQRVLRDAQEFENLADAVADCALVVGTTSRGPRALEHPLRRLERGGKLIARKLGSPVALLFGSEKFGLSNEDMSHCHWLMRIPTREEHGSMNLGQAVALCLYEIARDPAAARPQPEPRKPPARAADLERMTALLQELLDHCGYVHARTGESTRMKIRRLVRRMGLHAHDAEVWLGMLRQIRWKLLSYDR